MSKWLKKEDYEMFASEKAKEAENPKDENSFYRKWKNPTMGTVEKSKDYTTRLLPDKVKGFYKKYMYHGFKSGDKFHYILCEKTFDGENYCPWCDVNKILYQGNETDKKKAKDYKRQDRYVTNLFIKEDPRDAEVKDPTFKVNGTVRLYEFPSTVESKIANEINDKTNGYGLDIFNPEAGYDLILKVKAKPKDDKGKEWPDYGDTMFARKATSISDDDETLEKLMNDRYSLDEYILSMRKTVDEHEQLLKAEMLWDDVAVNFNKKMKNAMTPAVTTTTTPKKEEPKQEIKKETPSTPVVEDDDTDSLLDELDNM